MPFKTPMDVYADRLSAADRRRLLRPMASTELIDQAVRLIQIHGLKLLRATLLPTSLCYLALASFSVLVAPTIFGAQSDQFQGQVAEVLLALVMFLFACVPLFIMGIAYSVNLTSRLTARYMMGDPVEFEKEAEVAQRGQLGMAGTILVSVLSVSSSALLVALAYVGVATLDTLNPDNLLIDLLVVGTITLGSLALVVVPPIALGRAFLAPVINAIESKTGLQSLRRSKHLMAGAGHVPSGYSHLLAIVTLVGFVALCIWGGLVLTSNLTGLANYAESIRGIGRFGPVFAGLVDAAPGFLTAWLSIPLLSAIMTVLYYDRRVRLEAYDIKILAKDVLQADRSRIRA